MTQFLGPGIINNLSMYGGGYGGGYGNYSSYGGYSGMGSSYGGYGGLGSTYGSSYGSYGGLNRTASINQQNQNQPNNADPNQPPAQPINQRKLVIEEYFKMMGGLRSMVEIGFSMVALCNFTSRSWELLKKIVQFLVQTSKKLYMKLAGSHILTEKMSEVFEKAMLISPNSKNGNTLLNKVLMAMRITAAIILMVGIKLKSNLSKEVETEHEEILKKYEQIKLEQAKLQEHQNTDFQGESAYHKQGYF